MELVLVPVGEGVQCGRARIANVEKIKVAVARRGAVILDTLDVTETDDIVRQLLISGEPSREVQGFLLGI